MAMGALNASMHRAGKIPVSLTFVTGVLVRFGQGLGDFLARRSTGWKWLAQASPWIGLIAGATIGSIAHIRIGGRQFGFRSYWPASSRWAQRLYRTRIDKSRTAALVSRRSAAASCGFWRSRGTMTEPVGLARALPITATPISRSICGAPLPARWGIRASCWRGR